MNKSNISNNNPPSQKIPLPNNTFNRMNNGKKTGSIPITTHGNVNNSHLKPSARTELYKKMPNNNNSNNNHFPTQTLNISQPLSTTNSVQQTQNIYNNNLVNNEHVSENLLEDFNEIINTLTPFVQNKQYDQVLIILEKILKEKQRAPLLIIKLLEFKTTIHLLKQEPIHASDTLNLHSRLILKEHITTAKRSKEDLNQIYRLKMHASIHKKFKNLKTIKNQPEDAFLLDKFIMYALSKTKVSSYFSERGKEVNELFEKYIIENRNKERVEKNYNWFLEYLNNYEPSPQVEEDDFQLDIKREDKYKKDIESATIKVENAWDSYVNEIRKIITDLEIQRQNEVEDKFFNPERTTNPKALEFSLKILNLRYAVNANSKEEAIFQLTGISSRSLAIAERATVGHSLNVQNRDQEMDQERFYAMTPENNNTQCRNNNSKESFVCGDIKVNYTVYQDTKSKNHVGNCLIENLGSYPEIAIKLNVLVNNDLGRSKRITDLIIKLFNKGTPITPESLAPILNLSVDDQTLKLHALFLTRLAFNLLRESFRRVAPYEREHKLPHAVMLSRGLLMAREGKILITDLFREQTQEEYKIAQHPLDQPFGSLYSIYTAPEGKRIASHIDEVIPKVEFINDVFTKCLAVAESKIPTDTYLYLASTQEEIHSELCEVFGGESDSDGCEYFSDEDYKNFPLEDSSAMIN